MDELSGALGSVWARNLEAQERRIAAQEAAIVAMLAGTPDDAGRHQAAQAAHKLAGSLGSFGLNDGSRLASSLGPRGKPTRQISSTRRRWRSRLRTCGARCARSSQQPSLNHVSSLRRVRSGSQLTSCSSTTTRSSPTSFRGARIELEAVDLASRWRVCLRRRLRPEASLRPRVVLLDIEMPGLDGFALLELLAARGLTRETRVIMLTQRTMLEDVGRARKLGVTDYLAKPLQAPTLIDRVTRALAA